MNYGQIINIFLLSYTTTKFVISNNSSKCLDRTISQYYENEAIVLIHNNFQNFPANNNLKTIYNILPKNLQGKYVIVLTTNNILDYNLILNNTGPDKNIILVQEVPITTVKAKALFLEAWFKYRIKLGILTIQNNITFITNLKLQTTKICTRFSYEEHLNYCSPNASIRTRYLTQNDVKTLCKFKVAWVRSEPFVNDIKKEHNPGVAVSLLRTYQQISNVRIDLQRNEDYQKELLNNGTFHRLHKDILLRKVDVAIGHLFMNTTKVLPLSYGPLLFNDYVYLVTRKRKKIASYKKLIVVFQPSLWKGFVIAFFVVIVTYFIICQLVNQRLGVSSTIMNVFRLSLGCSLPILPKSTSLRLLLAFYSLFCINIDSMYLGKLSSIFTNAPYDVIVKNVGVLLRDGLRFKVSWLMERLCKLTYAVKDVDKSLRVGNAVMNLSEAEILKWVAATQKYATFTFLSNLIVHTSEAELVDYVREKRSFFVSFYIRPECHLKDSLQFWANEMVEKGFVYKWFKDIIEENRNNSLIPAEKKVAKPLKLMHFEEMFDLLAFGHVLAFLVLILELVIKKLENRFAVSGRIGYLVNLLY